MTNQQDLVFVLDSDRKPLTPWPARARSMLKSGQAAVFPPLSLHHHLHKALPHAKIEALRLKQDSGSKITGLVLVEEKSGKSYLRPIQA